MQVQKISGISPNNRIYNIRKNNIKTNINHMDSFQPSFSGFNKILEIVSKMEYKNDKSVEEAFDVLLKEVFTTPKYTRTKEFIEIFEKYKSLHFRGLMHELWSANPDKNIQKIIDKAEKIPVILATDNNEPIMEIISFGRHGFWNNIFNKSTATHDVKIAFLNRKKGLLMEFGLSRHGACKICQEKDNGTVFTTFHNSTGNRKIVTIQPDYGNPETSYYKKDGSDNELLNFFQGGPIVNIF